MAPGFHRICFGQYVTLLAGFVSLSNALLSSTGFTVSLDDVPYYISPESVASIPVTKAFLSGSSNSFFTPITVVSTDDVGFSAATFASVVFNWTGIDDVFQNGFLKGTFPSPIAWSTNG